ncbi:uncharacterized protein LOC135214542 [Macrobrachium nipponense]|uniref:uncharacterized protein LOC135214542 n=1 Tax=Macrobrachium nipponense TaxID=159736 RepID=UPI0030C88864
MGTKHHTTMSYNPTANSMVERVHCSLKASLMAHCQGTDWKAQLPWILLGLHTAPRANDDPSPAEKVYGETLTAPETYIDRRKQFRLRALDSCRFIFVRNDVDRSPLMRPHQSLHRVVHQEEKAFLVSIGGRKDWVSIDHLKPAIFPNEDHPAEGPCKTHTLLVPDSVPKRR